MGEVLSNQITKKIDVINIHYRSNQFGSWSWADYLLRQYQSTAGKAPAAPIQEIIMTIHSTILATPVVLACPSSNDLEQAA